LLGEISCSKCEISKSAKEFSKGMTFCKPCNAERVRNKKSIITPLEIVQRREALQLIMDTHKCSDHDRYMSKCVECRKIYQYFANKKNREKPLNKAMKINDMYGLSLTEYNKLVEDQHSQCSICLCTTDDLVVDHHHTTLKVRALLCASCNLAIGLFKEKVEVLNKVIDYLKRSQNQ